MHLHRPTTEVTRQRENARRRSRDTLPVPHKGRGRTGSLHSIKPAAAALFILCLLTGLGCSSDKRNVEDVALQWVEGIKTGNPETFERIIDWQRWYSTYSKPGRTGTGSPGEPGQENEKPRRRIAARPGQTEEMPEDLEYQKGLLVSVLSTDKVLATQYLTAINEITRVSVKKSEAVAEISQEDRTTGRGRRIILQMHKDPDAGWRIYKFTQEELEDS